MPGRGRYAMYGMIDLPQYAHLKEERKRAAENKRVRKNYINSVFCGGGSKSKKVSKVVSTKDVKKPEQPEPKPWNFSLRPEREREPAKAAPSKKICEPTQKKTFCDKKVTNNVPVCQVQKAVPKNTLVKTAATSHKRKFVDSDPGRDCLHKLAGNSPSNAFQDSDNNWSDNETPKRSRPSPIPVPKNNSSDFDKKYFAQKGSASALENEEKPPNNKPAATKVLSAEEKSTHSPKFEEKVEKMTEWFDKQSNDDQIRFVQMLLSRMKCQPTTLNRDLAALPPKFCSPKDISESQNKKLEKEVQNLKKDLEKSKHDLDDAKSLLQTKVEEVEKLKISRMNNLHHQCKSSWRQVLGDPPKRENIKDWIDFQKGPSTYYITTIRGGGSQKDDTSK